MDYQEFFGRLAFFAFLGLICSGVITHILMNVEEKRGFPFSQEFWKELKIGVWVLVFAFGIGVDVWLVMCIIDWLGTD
jgi:hypothetical protein